MGGEVTQLLLTEDERQAKLDALFGHRFTERGKLQLPTTKQYNALHTDQGLQDLTIELCRWLGLKPNGLTAQYSKGKLPEEFQNDITGKTITINRLYRTHPYTTAALLAQAVTAYSIERYDHHQPDMAFVEFATVELGLGIWIVNALKPKIGLSQRLYHLIDSSWFHAEGIQLTQYQPRQYTERVVNYAHENRIAPETYVPHIAKRCRHLLPTFISDKVPQYLPETGASLRHKKSARILWLKVVLIALIIANGTIVGLYALASSPNTNDNSAKHEQLEAIEILKKAHQKCLKEASEQQSTYDPNDLFMTRQIDATKSRCESLRNEYNAAIDQYQKLR